MELSKHDIGAEVISILTKGMYPDPRDAIREYIQNAVDAKSDNLTIKVRKNSVVIDDDGNGMNYETLRKAIRVGVSEKNPKKNVGFMGIGIYSSFHLCNILELFTREEGGLPYKLKMDFLGMRRHLNEQKALRLKGQISDKELTDLQTLLENYITLTKIGELKEEDFPKVGTRVELTGLDPSLDSSLSDFIELSKYIKDVAPLHFDKDNFKWGKEIEEYIIDVCTKYKSKFELINIDLHVGTNSEKLFRPYTDSEFANNTPQKPKMLDLKKAKTFLGVAWGCLNSTRNKIKNSDVRGFIIKKQGFTIGKRGNLARSFGASNTHFDRYIGEIVLVNSDILPNASRSDLEYSDMRVLFYSILSDVASKYNANSQRFQDESVADDQIKKSIKNLKELYLEYSLYEEDTSNLVNLLIKVRGVISDIAKKIDDVSRTTKKDAELVKTDAAKLEKLINNRLDFLTKKQGRKSAKKERTNSARNKATHDKIGEDLEDIDSEEFENKRNDTLYDLMIELDFNITEELDKFIRLLDEKFSDFKNYPIILDEIKEEYLNL